MAVRNLSSTAPSASVIGNGNFDQDLVYQNNISASLLRNIALSTNEDIEVLEKKLCESSLRNKDIQDHIAQGIIVNSYKSHAEKSRPTVYVRQVLNVAQQSLLQSSYHCFDLDFRQAIDSSPHGFARASRELERRYMMDKLKISDDSVPLNGYDVVLKDVGGNPITHMNRSRLFFHTCFPILDSNDGMRHANYRQELLNVKKEKLTKIQAQCYQLHINGARRVICHKPAQYCTVTSQNLLFLHSVYNINNSSLARMMATSNALHAMGCFIFSPEILINNKGTLKHLECHYEKFVRRGTMYIRFWFENDCQDAYEHNYDTYIQLIRSRYISTRYDNRMHYYYVQPLEIKNSVLFFKIAKSSFGQIPASISTTVWTCESLEDKLILYYYNWKTVGDRLFTSARGHMKPVRVVVPKKMYDNLYSYALVLPEGKLTIKNLMTAAFTFNSREIVSGQSIQNFVRMEPRDVQYLVHAIFLFVYISQYECSQAMSVLISQESKIREFEKKSFLRRLFNMNTIYRGDNFMSRPDFHNLVNEEAKLSIECEETSRFRQLYKEFVQSLIKRTHAEREYDTIMSDLMCRFLTVSQELEILNAPREYHDSGRLNVDVCDLMSIDDVKNAIFADLPERPIQLHDINSFQQVVCDSKNFKVVENASDGDCIYESMRDHEFTRESTQEIRSRLRNSPYLTQLMNYEFIRDNLAATKVPDCYGTEGNFLLIAMEYQITVCIHTDTICRRFGYGPIYHFRIRDKHCVALVYDYKLDDVENFQLDRVCLPATETISHFSLVPDSDGNCKFCDLPAVEHLSEKISALFKRERNAAGSAPNFNKKVSVAFDTADSHSFLKDCNNFGYRSRYGLVLKEALVRYVPHRDVDSVFMCSSESNMDVLKEMFPCRRYVYSVNPDFDVSDVIPIPTDFTVSDILSTRENLTQVVDRFSNRNYDACEYFIGSMYCHNKFPHQIDIQKNSDLLSFQVVLCSQILKPKCDALFLCSVIPSEKLYFIFSYLSEMFEEVIISEIQSIRLYNPYRVIVCRRRVNDIHNIRKYLSLLDPELSINDNTSLFSFASVSVYFSEFSNRLYQTSQLLCRHIHNAGTRHEQNLTIDEFTKVSYEKLLKPDFVVDTVIAGALPKVLLRGAKFIKDLIGSAPVEDGNLEKFRFNYTPVENEESSVYESAYDALSDFEPSIDHASLPEHPIGEHKPETSFKSIVSSVYDIFVDPNIVPNCQHFEDYSTGITFNPIRPICPSNSPLVLKSVNDVQEKIQIQPEIVEEKPYVPESFTPCALAQKEYLSYLESTFTSDASNVRLFFDRVLKSKNSLDDAVREFPGRFGIIDIETKRFVVTPHEYQSDVKYNKYYDSRFELMDYPEDDKAFQKIEYPFVYRERACILVNEFCLFGFEREMYNILSGIHDFNWVLPSDVSIVQAGPGTGKTTYIVKNHELCTSNNPSTVILSTTEGCIDFRRRVSKQHNVPETNEFRTHYRTLASYLLNPNKNPPCETLFVDEALMSHPGAIFFAIQMSGAKFVRMLGDVMQIPFVNRTPNFVCHHDKLINFVTVSEVLDVSYRCPLDVAYRLHPEYLRKNKEFGIDKGLRSANPRSNTCCWARISGISDIPYDRSAKYLTFTHSDKQQLKLSLNVDVSTVHEYQGKESDHVIIVRLNHLKNEKIFENIHYAIVALTRHKVSCRYYSKVDDDALIRYIKVNNVTIFEIAVQSQMRQLLVANQTISAGSSSGLLYIEESCLFASSRFNIVSCIGRDMKSVSGINAIIKARFEHIPLRFDENLDRVAYQYDGVGKRYIVSLITKEKSCLKTTYDQYFDALVQLLKFFKKKGVHEIHIPKTSCGIENLDWDLCSLHVRKLCKEYKINIVLHIVSDDIKSDELEIEVLPINVFLPNTSYSTFEQRNGRLSMSMADEVHFVPRFGFYKFNPKYLPSIVRGIEIISRNSKLIYCIESSENYKQSPSIKYIVKTLQNNRHVKFPSTFGINSGVFSFIEPSVLSSVLYKYISSYVILFDTSFTDEIEPQVFSLLNVNATIEIPNSEVSYLNMFFPTLQQLTDICLPPVISIFQRVVDDVFYETAYIDQTLDAWMVHTEDLILSSAGYRYSSLKGIFSFPTYDFMCPTLKTPMYQVRGTTSREIRLALEKRNLAVPKLSGIVDYEEVSQEMLLSFIENYFDPEKLKIYNNENLTLSANDVHTWLKKQDSFVLDQIIPDFDLHRRAINEYMYSIKRSPKPNLTIDAAKSYAALQTIVYHEKDINALFCTQFKKIKDKITRSLLPHVLMFCDMSPKQFVEKLNCYSEDCLAVFSGDDSYLWDGLDSLEIDISKYDKSQGILALEYDCKILSYFGMPPYLVELWYYGHFLTKVYDRGTSLQALIPFQRKSGDASTFILNTTFLMGVISHEIPIKYLNSIRLSDYHDPMKYALLFNLEVKFFHFKYPYFCSKFLIKTPSGWIFCPDPIKLLVKLGRSDLVNDKHVEYYRVSFQDNVQCYKDVNVCHYVSKAVAERYNVTIDICSMLQSLPSLALPEYFSQLYYIKPGSKIDHTRYQFNIKD